MWLASYCWAALSRIWRLIGSILHWPCRCWMSVMLVQPYAILSADFCTFCIDSTLVSEAVGVQTGEAYSKMERMKALYVIGNVYIARSQKGLRYTYAVSGSGFPAVGCPRQKWVDCDAQKFGGYFRIPASYLWRLSLGECDAFLSMLWKSDRTVGGRTFFWLLRSCRVFAGYWFKLFGMWDVSVYAIYCEIVSVWDEKQVKRGIRSITEVIIE